MSTWDVNTSPKTASITIPSGTYQLVCGGVSQDSSATLATPTGGTGVTWTLRQSIVVASYCSTYLWTATVSTAQTFSISIASAGSGLKFGFIAMLFGGSDGFGASGKANAAGASSLTFSTTGDNSAIGAVIGDWAAADGTSRTWRTVNSVTPTVGNGMERAYFRNSADYSAYAGYWSDAGAAGSKQIGLSAPTGMAHSTIGVEVLGTAAAGGYVRPKLVMATGFAVTRAASW